MVSPQEMNSAKRVDNFIKTLIRPSVLIFYRSPRKLTLLNMGILKHINYTFLRTLHYAEP